MRPVPAAKFVMEKNATDRVIQKTADQIVAEILVYASKFRECNPYVGRPPSLSAESQSEVVGRRSGASKLLTRLLGPMR